MSSTWAMFQLPLLYPHGYFRPVWGLLDYEVHFRANGSGGERLLLLELLYGNYLSYQLAL
jgi:hypothetical protein